MIVLDTSVNSELFKPTPEPRVVRWLSSIEDDVAITTITLAELLAGIRRLPPGARRNTRDFVRTGVELVDPGTADA